MFELEMPHGKEKSFISREFPNNGNPAFGFSRFSYKEILNDNHLRFDISKPEISEESAKIKCKKIKIFKL